MEKLVAMLLSSCARIFRHNSISVVIVYATLMIDNMLLTSVVPILPEFFIEEQHREEMLAHSDNTTYSNESSTSTTAIAVTDYHFTNTTETNFTKTTYIVNTDCAGRDDKKKLAAKNLYLALLLASKPFVQLIANIFVGPLIDKFGYDIPMFFGYIVLIGSSLSKYR